ncbi:MAG: hypothetical protein CMJ23_12845, partial [Phycisphaerae bacterium]|nr:hypothetical protein [Phycisphaerae bacterium]
MSDRHRALTLTTLALTAVAAAGLGVSSAHAQDAVQWTEAEGGNGHWYQAIELSGGPGGVGGTQEMYLNAARNLGGDLASVTTPGENQWIRSNIADREQLWEDNGNGCVCVGPM